MDFARDTEYVELFLEPIRVCASYLPKFGIGRGEAPIDLPGYQALVGTDPLYSWIGLDSKLMYAAHKAAGGMTSVYRQVGIGCERLFRAVVRNQLNLTPAQVAWSYEVPKQGGGVQTLTLDARIDSGDVADAKAKRSLTEWIVRGAAHSHVAAERQNTLRGAIFEVRQGYKSADSKRQNADLRFGLRASSENYLPVILVVSRQVSQAVVDRYRGAGLMVLTGTQETDDTRSTFAFCEHVLGYSLKGFFERNSPKIKGEVQKVLESLLSGDGPSESPD